MSNRGWDFNQSFPPTIRHGILLAAPVVFFTEIRHRSERRVIRDLTHVANMKS